MNVAPMALAIPLMVFAQAVAAQSPQLSVIGSTRSALDSPQCFGSGPNDIVVCGQLGRSYRIDTNVLQAERATTAVPDRQQVLDPNRYAQCVGPNCGGDFIPLVPIAERLLIAGIDAASGRDWRQDFRTHPDEYAAYEEAKKKRAKVTVSVSAGSSR